LEWNWKSCWTLSSTTTSAPSAPATQTARSAAAITGMIAAATICTSLMRKYQRLFERAWLPYHLIWLSRRSQAGGCCGSAATSAAAAGEAASCCAAIGVVVALIASPP
jgi:hypothetical protein